MESGLKSLAVAAGWDRESQLVEEVSQYLTWTLGNELYGIEILKVQEIRGYSPATPIPNTPPYVKGVINLRGSVVPVVEMRTKFNLPTTEYDKFTVIIVANLGSKTVGMLVDSVSEVMDVPRREIRPAPEFGAAVDVRFISGITTSNDRIVVLLDVDRMLQDIDTSAPVAETVEV